MTPIRCPKCHKLIATSRMGIDSHYRSKHPNEFPPTSQAPQRVPYDVIEQYLIERFFRKAQSRR